jgi:hypothetical protein
MTLKLDLRSHASRITNRHARRSSSEAYDELNTALKTPAPEVENKGNIDLVGKYYDKLLAALGDDEN